MAAGRTVRLGEISDNEFSAKLTRAVKINDYNLISLSVICSITVSQTFIA